MIAWLIYNESLKNNKFSEVHHLYEQAAKINGIKLSLVSNQEVMVVFSQGKEKLVYSYQTPEFILFLDKDIFLAKQLEDAGFLVYNSGRAIEICDNKAETVRILHKVNIAMPKTIVAPLVFKEVVNPLYYEQIAKQLGYPLVIKEAYGSFGEQVYLVHDINEVKNVVSKIGTRPYIFQEYIDSSRGEDLRVYVVFGEVILVVKRKNLHDFRANVTNGGTMEPYMAKKEYLEMAINATKAVGASFTGVDILFGKDDEPILCEVNSNAHIKNVYDMTKVNIADFIFKGIKHEIGSINL